MRRTVSANMGTDPGPAARSNLAQELTSFVGRELEVSEVRRLITDGRLVTLVGSGGCGKTRLALRVAAEARPAYADGVWRVNLAPISDPELVSASIGSTLGLQDEVGRSMLQTIVRHFGAAQLLVVLDNCEHLVDESARVVEELAKACPAMVVLATSREPLGVPGETVFRVPSLTPEEARSLFVERARKARSDFSAATGGAEVIDDICGRLDGIPLAIELAAARVRVLTPSQIADGLSDRFRLLTGGSRTSVRRQQTLRTSVDWSHALLTDLERILFRRLGVFAGAFDLEAATMVGADGDLAAHHILDQLASLVDKSLVLSVDTPGGARYRMLETIRQYALERLSDSTDADGTRRRHRDHFLAVAMRLGFGVEAASAEDERVARLEADLDNFRVALQWSRDAGEPEAAAWLAVLLFFLWNSRGHLTEGRRWFDALLAERAALSQRARVFLLTFGAQLEGFSMGDEALSRAREAVALARELDDDAVLSAALSALVNATLHEPISSTPVSVAEELAIEGVDRARRSGDTVPLCTALYLLGLACWHRPAISLPAFEECVDLATRTASTNIARTATTTMAHLMVYRGDLDEALALARQVEQDGREANDRLATTGALVVRAVASAYAGDVNAALVTCHEALRFADDLGMADCKIEARTASGIAHLAAADLASARAAFATACDAAGGVASALFYFVGGWADAELAGGDVDRARARLDDWLATNGVADLRWAMGWALAARSRVAVVDGELRRADDLAHEALAIRVEFGDKPGVADTLELLAWIAAEHQSCQEAVRLSAAAEGVRATIGCRRLGVYDHWSEATTARCKAALEGEEFSRAWSEGHALTLEESVAYARRGRGERKRPARGWPSLTPAEQDVARLVADGLSNAEIADRLFISPRTVNAHLTRVYRKVGIASRVQLAREAAQRL